MSKAACDRAIGAPGCKRLLFIYTHANSRRHGRR